MEKVNYFLNGGLSDDQIKYIFENAVKIVDEIGVDVSHESTLKLLAGLKGVRIKGKRVRFDPFLAESFFKPSQLDLERFLYSREEPREFNGFNMRSTGPKLNTLNMRTGEIRPPTAKDLIKFTKLEDSYGLSGPAPVVPQDIPLPLQEIALHKFCWENSENIGGGVISTIPAAEYIYEMSQVMNKPFYTELWMVSPLQVDSQSLDIIFHFLDRKVDMTVGTFAIAGATTPLSFPGAWVQTIAEDIAGFIILKLISRGGRIIFRTTTGVHPCNFKYCNVAVGGPEEILIRLIGLQLMRDLGYEPWVTIATMAKEPDSQAGAEKLANILVFTLNGVRNFFGAGGLSWDEIFSAQQLVIDMEILKYARRIVRGFEFKKNGSYFKTIKEVGPGGSYLVHSSTVKNFRDVIWMSDLFERSMLKQGKGNKSIREKTREIAERRIRDHRFELDKNKKRELDKIYNKAAKD